MAQIGPYSIREQLGHGGSGTVHRAEVMQDVEALGLKEGDSVALKLLLPKVLEDEIKHKRLEREISFGQELKHANLVRLFEGGTVHMDGMDVPYIVQEYVEGRTLRQELTHCGKFSEERARSILAQILLGLQAIHEQDLVHRDLKPENILISADGTVKLMDYGLIKVGAEKGGEPLTEPGMFVGTLAYASPEQFTSSQELDLRADLFSLGVMGFEMVTGENPFMGRNLREVMRKITAGAVPSARSMNTEVSAFYDKVVARLLEKDRGRRFQTARAVLNALEQESFSPAGAGEHWELPLTGREAELPTFGRMSELDKLRATFAASRELGEGRVVALAGEHGVGKTRVLREFTRTLTAHDERFSLLVSTCRGGDCERPEYPLRRLLETSSGAGALPSAQRHGRIQEYLTSISPSNTDTVEQALSVLDERADSGPAALTAVETRRLERLLRRMILDISETRPVLLVFEDCHHCMEGTLGLILRLPEEVWKRPLAVICSFDPTRLDPLHGGDPAPLIELFTRGTYLPEVSRLQLRPLARDEILEILDSLNLSEDSLGGLITPTMMKKSRGNPLLLLESLRQLELQEKLAQTGDRLVMHPSAKPEDLPSSFEELCAARIELLSDEERDIVHCGAVLGERFDVRMVESCLSIERIPLIRSLKKMADVYGIVVEVDGGIYRFRAPCSREYLLGMLEPDALKKFHKCAARYLLEHSRLPGGQGKGLDPVKYPIEDCPRIAWHLARAGKQSQGMPFLKTAVDHLIGNGRPHAAQLLCKPYSDEYLPAESARAREAFDLLSLKLEVFAALGDESGRRNCLAQLAALAESVPDPEMKEACLMVIADGALKDERPAQVVEHVTRAREICSSRGGKLAPALMLMEGRALFELGRPSDAEPLLETARAGFAEARDYLGESESGMLLARCHWNLARLNDALKTLKQVKAAHELAGRKTRHPEALRLKARILNDAGRLKEGIAELDKLLNHATDQGDQRLYTDTLLLSSLHHVEAGDLERADEYLNIAQGILPTLRDLRLEGLYLLGLGSLMRVRGDLSSAALTLEEARNLYADGFTNEEHYRLEREHGECLFFQGFFEAARDRYLKALAIADSASSILPVLRARINLALANQFMENPSDAEAHVAWLGDRIGDDLPSEYCLMYEALKCQSLLQEGQMREGGRYLSRLFQEDPASQSPHLRLMFMLVIARARAFATGTESARRLFSDIGREASQLGLKCFLRLI